MFLQVIQHFIISGEQLQYLVADKDGNIVNTFELSTKSYNQLKDQYPALPEGALQWNTERDGSGKTILANTKIFEDITLYPIYKDITNVTVKVNDGAALGGANLALAIGKAGADSVTKLEVVSGKMTKADYLWMNKGIMTASKRSLLLTVLKVRTRQFRLERHNLHQICTIWKSMV